ncbi:MAG: hypothetical protein IPO21_06320 [Bacteroidales bacterium]|nr:hypothetical protein [Bacteroidales bacterium]
MKAFLLLLLFNSFFVFISAQQIDIDKKKELAAEYSSLSVRYQFRTDSLNSVISRWVKYCGVSEPNFRMKILSHIAQDKSVDSIINVESFAFIVNYLYRVKLGEKDSSDLRLEYQTNAIFYGFIPIGEDFDEFTQKYALKLRELTTLDAVDTLFLQLYSNNIDTFLNAIETDDNLQKANVKSLYDNEMKSIASLPDGNVSIGLGLWTPIGNMAILGVHPSVQLQLGVYGKKVFADIAIETRFLQSANSYLVNAPNIGMVNSERFFSVYLGVQPGYVFF